MRVLVVSFYAEDHLISSAAQNARLMAQALAGTGHSVTVVCAAETAKRHQVDGYCLVALPILDNGRRAGWLQAFRPDSQVRCLARDVLDEVDPEVVLVGAFQHLTEVALEAQRRAVPCVQVVHDYSLICLRQWLLDGNDELCTGPSSQGKCVDCFRRPLGLGQRLLDRALSFSGVGLGSGRAVTGTVGEAFDHMARYRRAITLFVAQAPSVPDILSSAGVAESQCRWLPQFLGEERLQRLSRPAPPNATGSEAEPARPIRVAYVGRWSHAKGPDLLFQALVDAPSFAGWELLVISRSAMPELAPRGHLKAVRVIDDAEGARVSELLAGCDLCVVPSRCRELASRVVLEAFAQGVPVIASGTVGNRWLIEDGKSGRVFENDDPDALIACLTEIGARPEILAEWSKRLPQPIGRSLWTDILLSILYEAQIREVDR